MDKMTRELAVKIFNWINVIAHIIAVFIGVGVLSLIFIITGGTVPPFAVLFAISTVLTIINGFVNRQQIEDKKEEAVKLLMEFK